jgi:hypothetical protein
VPHPEARNLGRAGHDKSGSDLPPKIGCRQT